MIAIVVRELHGYKYEYVAAFDNVIKAQKYIEDYNKSYGVDDLRIKQDILR